MNLLDRPANVEPAAQQVDVARRRQTSEPRLDPAEAQAAALDYLTQVGATGTASVAGLKSLVLASRKRSVLRMRR